MNRPKVLNAINEKTFLELRKAFREFRNTNKIRAIVITGSGRAFSAGNDLKAPLILPITKFPALGRLVILEIKTGVEFDDDPEEYFERILNGGEINWKIGEKWKPVIAQINGYALGGGLEIAFATDFRLAGESAILGFPEVDLGLFPSWGGVSLASIILGAPKSKYLIYSCDKITANRAKELGVVDKVFKDDELAKETLAFAKRLVKKDQKILKDVKNMVEQAYGEHLIKGLAMEHKYVKTWDRKAR